MELISASIAVIASEGLPAATLRRVAQAAGYTTGALTHYYDSRNQLLRDTLRTVHRAAGERMLELVSDDNTPLENLRAVLLESLPLDQQRLNEWRVWLAFWSVSMDDKVLSDENAKRYAEWTRLVEGLIASFVSRGTAKVEAAALVAFIDGLGIGLARHTPDRRSVKTRQRDCVSLLNHYLHKFEEA